jgi:hypothetical protein
VIVLWPVTKSRVMVRLEVVTTGSRLVCVIVVIFCFVTRFPG